MIYILILIIGVLCFVILEEIILDMKSNIKDQKQKIKLSEELRLRLKASNETLNNSIYNFNFEMLEDIYSKK